MDSERNPVFVARIASSAKAISAIARAVIDHCVNAIDSQGVVDQPRWRDGR